MTAAQLVLAAGALSFAGFGVWLLVAPRALHAVGIPADNAEARTEIRAMYGGLELGLAAFLLLAAMRPEWHAPGLLLQLLALGLLATARWLAIAMEGGRVKRLIFFFAALELVAAVVTAWAYARL